MNKIVYFAFQGEKMCFNHILLYVLDLHKKGYEAKIVLEGQATKLVQILIEEEHPLFKQVMELNLIDSVCKACANQTGSLEYIENNTNLRIDGEMMGHPSMEPFIKDGYKIITL